MVTRAIILIFCLAAAVACSGDSAGGVVESLLVTDGTDEQHYSVDDLEELASEKAVFGGVSYVGVPLAALLIDAGYDPAKISAVKATAEDGFTANYGLDLVNRSDTLVAYATGDGALTEDDGTFRMVLPDQEGKLNPRHLVEIKIIR
jgi:DMSO/TMAO reductase YedYZ molybdopterin-dependent catalytic subunit